MPKQYACVVCGDPVLFLDDEWGSGWVHTSPHTGDTVKDMYALHAAQARWAVHHAAPISFDKARWNRMWAK